MTFKGQALGTFGSHHAEPVALRIRHDHVVGVGEEVVSVHLGGTETFQAIDIRGLILGVEVEIRR